MRSQTRAALRAAALLPLLLACRAPAPRPLDAPTLGASLDARADADVVAEALSRLEPLLSYAPDATDDPRRDDWWHACALAWSPSVRAARREWRAATARAGSAGAPGPVQVPVEVQELDDPGDTGRAMPTLDLVGLLGLEPADAARALADTEVRHRFAVLEDVAWSARFEVDRARVALAAARAERAQLQALLSEAEAERARIAILDEHGRLAAGALAAARTAERALAARVEALTAEEARAREALAVAAGLPPTAAALDAPRALDAHLDPPAHAVPTDADLLTRHPALRHALLDYAVAEAQLRDVAAARWPDLRLGPHVRWTPLDTLLGARAVVAFPWPGSIDGAVASAREAREAARERAEDALLAARARVVAADERAEAARGRLERGAGPAAEESERAWHAARARFGVDPGALHEWASALRARTAALAELERSRAALALAGLDATEARGAAAAGEEVRS